MSHRPRATGPKPQTLFPAKVTDYDTEGNHIMTDAHWLLPGTLLALLAGGVRGYTNFGFAMTLALGLLWLPSPASHRSGTDAGYSGRFRAVAPEAADRTLLAFSMPGGMSLLDPRDDIAALSRQTAYFRALPDRRVATFLPTGLISRSRRRDKAMAVPAGAARG